MEGKFWKGLGWALMLSIAFAVALTLGVLALTGLQILGLNVGGC